MIQNQPFISETGQKSMRKRVAWTLVGVANEEGGSKSHGLLLQEPGGVRLFTWELKNSQK